MSTRQEISGTLWDVIELQAVRIVILIHTIIYSTQDVHKPIITLGWGQGCEAWMAWPAMGIYLGCYATNATLALVWWPKFAEL